MIDGLLGKKRDARYFWKDNGEIEVVKIQKINVPKLIALLLALVTMLSASNCYMVKAENSSSGYDQYLDMIKEDSGKKQDIGDLEPTTNQEYAEVNQVIDEQMIEKELKNPVYDNYNDDYAGKYVKDNGEIVVCTCDKKETAASLKEVKDFVNIEKVEFNLDHLVAVKKKIDNKLLALDAKSKNGSLSFDEKKLYDNIAVVSISVKDNCVKVSFLEKSDYYKDLFKKIIISDDSIKYGTSENVKDTAARGLELGRAVYKLVKKVDGWIYTSRCSIGYPAMHHDSKGNRVYGFITCAHGLKKGDKIYLDESCTNSVGKVTKWKLSGNVDAAFVQITNSKYTTSRKVRYYNSAGKVGGGVTISGQSWYYSKDSSQGTGYNPASGEQAWKAGSTTYLTTGKIIDTWVSVTTETGTITDVYQTNVKIAGGDSGGLFFQKDDTNKYSVMGIVKASGSGYSYHVRIEDIQKVLGLYILGEDLYHNKTITR